MFLWVICLMDYLVTTECVNFVEFKEKIKKNSVSITDKYTEYIKSSLSEKILLNEYSAK